MAGVGWAGLIALVAVVFSAGAAWTMWRRGPLARALLAAPLLMPSALAFAGWGLLRAPDTWLGAVLNRAAQEGWHAAPVVAGRVLAVLGLALWIFPVGAVVIYNGLRGLEATVLEAFKVDGGGRRTVALGMARASTPDIARGWLLMTLLLLGSSVPLHLAQIETLAIQVWFALDNLGRDQQWRAWAGAWPLIVIALAAGWWLGGWTADFDPGESRSGGTTGSASELAPGAIPWALGVLVPLALFVANLGEASALGRVWELHAPAIRNSGWMALGAAIGSLLLSLGTGRAMSGARTPGRAARLIARLALAWALVPGVLVGSAVAGTVELFRSAWLDRSILPVVCAHVARFGFIGVLAGCWAANTARRLVGDQARLDGADRGPDWFPGAVAPVLGVHLAAAGATAVLSLHEIEATVQVMPPGDCLARVILGDLHYSRIADMSAAGVWLLLLGLVPVAATTAWRARARRRARANVNPFSSQQVP